MKFPTFLATIALQLQIDFRYSGVETVVGAQVALDIPNQFPNSICSLASRHLCAFLRENVRIIS